MDSRRFVEALIVAVPEPFADEATRKDHLEDPLPYVALAHASCWLEDHALRIRPIRRRATVRRGFDDVMRRFWAFVEHEAQAGKGDADLETLLQIECFEGVGWVEDIIGYVGPRTRELLIDAQRWLKQYNSQVGRWAEPPDIRRVRRPSRRRAG